MSQRNSGYARKENDLYETPAWVTEALLPRIPRHVRSIFEPSAGSGKMTAVFEEAGYSVSSADLTRGENFLDRVAVEADAIVTNPPYGLASEFAEHALRLTQARGGFVALLLRTDFDHAKSRQHLFGDCPQFAGKLVLTRRIVWFEPEPGQRGKHPSFNHAWFLWDHRHVGVASLTYSLTARAAA